MANIISYIYDLLMKSFNGVVAGLATVAQRPINYLMIDPNLRLKLEITYARIILRLGRLKLTQF